MKKDKLTAGLILGGIALIAVGLIVVDNITDNKDNENLVDLNETEDNYLSEAQFPVRDYMVSDQGANSSEGSNNAVGEGGISGTGGDTIVSDVSGASDLYESGIAADGIGDPTEIAGLENIDTESQGTADSQSTADSQGTIDSQGTAESQDTADSQGNADSHDTAEMQDTTDSGNESESSDTESIGTDTSDQMESANVDTLDEESSAEVMTQAVDNLTFNAADGLIRPISGEVLMKFSIDHGIYYKTLCQFKTNPALIIEAEQGSEVIAAADGIITSIEKSAVTGNTVTLSIGNGYEIIYGQLEIEDLETGELIEEGETIGTVASPTKYFTAEGANVYFQVLSDGEPVDPEGLFLSEE